MKKLIRWFDGALAVLVAIIFAFLGIGTFILPSQINDVDSNSLTFEHVFSLDLSQKTTTKDVALHKASGGSRTEKIKLFGIIPVKDAAVVNAGRQYVVPGGNSFGIKLYTDGVIVVGLTNIDVQGATKSPAKDAGLTIGDIIVAVDGMSVNTTEEVQEKLNASQGKPLQLRIKRDEQYLNIVFALEFSPSVNAYKAGLWIRDSTAGVGTVTFYNPANNTFAGLGHAVNDVDTNELMPLLTGEAVKAKVTGVYRGKEGETGSLSCTFDNEVIGKLVCNIKNGIYGTCVLPIDQTKLMPVATCQEIEKGAAQILTTVDGGEPQLYAISIERINYSNDHDQKNMIIKVTDEELLNKTGGVVQGMSGSPIIQNNRLIGAVTHVFVNNPTKGYAIFAENMVETSNGLK